MTDYINTEPFQAFHVVERLSKTLFRGRNSRVGQRGGGQMPFQYFSYLRIVFGAELKKGRLTQQKYVLNDYLCCDDKKINKTCVPTKLRMFLNSALRNVYNTHGRNPPPKKKSISRVMPVSYLTLILRRSRTGTVWFYTSTSNKRAARPKLYTKSLTRDLKLML